MRPINRGLWVSNRPGAVLKRGFLERVKEIGFTTVAVMVDTMRPGWDPQWTDDEVLELGLRCHQLGLELVITVWPDPNRERIDRMIADLERWAEAGLIFSALEVDVEGGWYVRDPSTGRKRRHPLYDELADYLMDRLLEFGDAPMVNVRIEITTHTGHYELTAGAKIATRARRVCVQAYTLRYGNGRTYQWSDPTRGPGRGQRRAVELFERVVEVDEEPPELTMGLAAWNQGFPGHTIAEAMQEAWDAAVATHPVEIRYWDSRNLFAQDPEHIDEAEEMQAWMEETFSQAA